MLLKKLKCIFLCAAMVLGGILLSGCDSSSAELVDEITAEATASVTAENTKAAAETVSETTTVTTTEATTEITTPETAAEVTAKTTAKAETEVPKETTTAVLPEITTKTQTETTTETTIETTTETTTETTAETTQSLNLTPEELEVYNSMPDIVFVLSHCYMSATRYSKYTNIRGFYITKDGEVKMYAFSDEEESKYIDVTKVYDELENVTCSELVFRAEEDEITQSDLDTVAISDLIELYNKLLLVDEKSKFKQSDNYCDVSCGIYELYGIRTNKNGKKEVILLSLRGDYYLTNKDIYAQEISDEVWNIGYPFSEYRMLS